VSKPKGFQAFFLLLNGAAVLKDKETVMKTLQEIQRCYLNSLEEKMYFREE